MTDTPTSRWLHRWSLLTVCAAVAMLTLGAVVTTFRVGMADPLWPTYPWHLLLIDWQEPGPGFFIEHTHRLMGHVLGCCVIVLAVGLWLYEPRPDLRRLGLGSLLAMVVTLALGFALKTKGTAEPAEGLTLRQQAPVAFWLSTTGAWLICVVVMALVVGGLLLLALRLNERGFWLRWLGTAALAGVMVQGLLGGFRVQLNALFGSDLAAAHGIFAQVVFALLVSLALLSGRAWGEPVAQPAAPGDGVRLRRLTGGLVALVLGQLVLGVLMRHTGSPAAQRGHLLVAFAVVALVVWLAQSVFAGRTRDRMLTAAVRVLAALLVVQVLLGVEAWMGKFAAAGGEMRAPTLPQAVLRTAHVLVGSWVLAAAVVSALWVRRKSAPVALVSAAPERRLEGAA